MKHICNISVYVVAGILFGAGLTGNTALATSLATQDETVLQAQPTNDISTAIKLAMALPNAMTDEARADYQASTFNSIWFGAEGDDGNAQVLLRVLANAGAHALPVERYRVAELTQAIKTAASGNVTDIAKAEIALTRAFLDYARDVRSGILEPRNVDRELHVFPERPDEQFLLAGLRRAPSLQGFLDGLPPQSKDYEALTAELAALGAINSLDWGDTVPAGRSIRFGEVGPRITAMRARLVAMGDHQEPAIQAEDFNPAVYDVDLEASVRAFQRRHGLNDDGIAGRRTIEAMNVSPADRHAQVVVNMERLRWMNRDLGVRHIYVNQADFTVQLMDQGEVIFNERVVVGKSRRHRTPEFSDQMTHLVLNPTWHLPHSIATEEILPKLQQDPTYLSRRNMRLIPRGGGAAPDPTLTDWTAYTASDFPFRIKQAPSARNALGRVKFMFPNQFAIYLHDTPSKRLFKKDARAFSHGCVRVQDPLRLAEALLGVQMDQPAEYIQRVLNRGRERRVNFEEPIPVHLTYRTAWVDEQGVRQFRSDIYGRDARVLTALHAAGVTRLGEG